MVVLHGAINSARWHRLRLRFIYDYPLMARLAECGLDKPKKLSKYVFDRMESGTESRMMLMEGSPATGCIFEGS
jgi:hypothetical protein